MFLNHHYLECPFCKKGTIELIERPSSYKHQRTYGAGSKSIMERVSAQFLVTTQKCPECGKSNEEITKKWKEEGVI
jgi:uncharacterized Zn finger protein